MSKQKKILNEIAKKNNIPITVAEEIYYLFTKMIADTISDKDKKTDDLFDVEKFKTIHIGNFGKFKPNTRNIRHANYCITKKKNEN